MNFWGKATFRLAEKFCWYGSLEVLYVLFLSHVRIDLIKLLKCLLIQWWWTSLNWQTDFQKFHWNKIDWMIWLKVNHNMLKNKTIICIFNLMHIICIFNIYYSWIYEMVINTMGFHKIWDIEKVCSWQKSFFSNRKICIKLDFLNWKKKKKKRKFLNDIGHWSISASYTGYENACQKTR